MIRTEINVGQQQIFNLFKKKKTWLLSKEIAKETGMTAGSLYRCLRILLNSEDIISTKARKVIKNKNRLKKSSKGAWAYKIK